MKLFLIPLFFFLPFFLFLSLPLLLSVFFFSLFLTSFLSFSPSFCFQLVENISVTRVLRATVYMCGSLFSTSKSVSRVIFKAQNTWLNLPLWKKCFIFLKFVYWEFCLSSLGRLFFIEFLPYILIWVVLVNLRIVWLMAISTFSRKKFPYIKWFCIKAVYFIFQSRQHRDWIFWSNRFYFSCDSDVMYSTPLNHWMY